MSKIRYFRPIVHAGPEQSNTSQILAGGWGWFDRVEVLTRGAAPVVIPASKAPDEWLEAFCASRKPVAGLDMGRPHVMGILNTTPDSFSDGGRYVATADAVSAGLAMINAGADILDIGGESTRPGAKPVAAAEEISRTTPVIAGLRAAGASAAISNDTRKMEVAAAALDAGATLINDVSGFTYDADLAPLCAARASPVCVMHALGDPETMQDDPQYDNVVLDVYDFLADRIAALIAKGVPRERIIADPGIGFGKTEVHNLALLARLSLFHGLGVPILLGASRKGFIGRIGAAPKAKDRAPGSIAVALAALSHGVQVLRVHDVAETVQAIALWRAAMTGKVI